MDKKEFLEGINKIEFAYSRKFTNEQLKLWYSKLENMEKEKFYAKIEEVVTKNKFMPSLAEITSETRKEFANYDQRDYTNLDFEKLYANKQRR